MNMIEQTSNISYLDTDIRISANCNFNAQDAYENAFEDLLMDKVSEDEHKTNEYKVNFASLGMPAGFMLDTSLIDDEFTCAQ